MDTIECKNIFVSDNEPERSQAFNEIWQMIVNLMINSRKDKLH